MKRRISVVLLLIFAACPVWAQLTTVIADDGTDRIVLKNGNDESNQRLYVTTLIRDQDERVAPLMASAPCATLGSQFVEKARSAQLNLETLVARYNLVNLWLGNLCHGKSDVLPTPEEAKAWLLGITRSTLPGNAHQNLGTQGMLVQLYLFGGPGSPPDYPAALALLNEEAAKGHFFIYMSYVDEHGLGVPKNQDQARAWLERAAQAGSPDAKMLLAQSKELNNDTEAFNSYLELSKAVYPPVWFRLGLMYLQGRGTQKDPCKAQEMLQKAASHAWSPVPQARKYLDQIREQNLCPQAVLKGAEPAGKEPPSQIDFGSEPAPCAVKLPGDTGELHPKRVDQSQKTIYDRAEYNAYKAALKLPDPRQKAAALEDFVTRYPQSVVKANALEQALTAYKASGNTAKLGDTANRLLQAQPDNMWALGIIASMARDCATRGAIIDTKAAGKRLLQLGQRGLAALPEWQEAQGASQLEAGKLRATFAGAAGWGALQNEDYGAARQFYEMALAVNPNNLMNLYELARADLSMTPIDPNGFWYCGKAVSIAQLQYKAAVGMMSFFCKLEFQKHGGKLEEWDRLVSNTEKDTAPPQDFAKSLSLQEPNQALQNANQTPGVVAPLPPSEKGDPISMLVLRGTDKGSPIGAGIGSGAVGGIAPTERLGHLPEVVSLSSKSLSSDDFRSRYYWYVQHVQRRVAAIWFVPANNNVAPRPVQISFEIQPDGPPSNVRIEQSSGVPALDLSAMRAVQRIDRFGPPPTHEKMTVKVGFSSDNDSPYGWYVQNINHKVAFNWHAPADPDPAGHRCTIAFVIQPGGSPSNVRVEQSSGFPALDESAMRAVQRIDSFGPVPTHEKIAVEFWFDSRK